jgi:hypothetical protein
MPVPAVPHPEPAAIRLSAMFKFAIDLGPGPVGPADTRLAQAASSAAGPARPGAARPARALAS